MKKRALKKILLSLVIAVVCMTMFMGSSCSYLIYSIYMKGYEQQVIEEEIKRREEKENQGNNGGEAIAREVYYNPVSAGEVAGYHMFTLVDSTTYTIDAYEYTTPAGGSAYSSRIFHMQGNYTREGNLVTVKAGISMYAYTTGSSSSQEFFPGESETERKAIYESFVGGEKYTIALKADGTFEAGGTADGEEAVTGVSGAKVYRWYDDSSRITIKTLTVFEDETYVITAFSTHSTNHEQPVSSFIANGTLSYSESESTEEYKIVDIQDGTGMCYVSNNGSPMWNDCIKDALGANWWDLSISNRSFYVTDGGFTYVNGMIKEEIPAGGLYGYVRDSGTEEPEEPETPEVLVTLQGDANSAIQLTLYKDGTADFTFTTYNSTTSGTWTFENGEFTFSGTANKQDGSTVEFENKSQVAADGTLVISIDTKNGMTQNYTLTAYQAALLNNNHEVLMALEGDANSAIQLILYKDGTADFTFTTYNATTSGVWSYKNGEFTFSGTANSQSGSVAFENKSPVAADGTIVIAIDTKNGMTQNYTLTAYQAALLNNNHEVLMALEGDANSAIQLILYKDGTADFTFTTYNATTSGVWSYKNGEFTFSGTANSQSGPVAFENKSQVEADGIIKIDTKNGMTQNYTLTAEQVASLG